MRRTVVESEVRSPTTEIVALLDAPAWPPEKALAELFPLVYPVEAYWTHTRAWLKRELGSGD